MVFKDLEGTKQARKELAEKESKMLLSLQGSKPSKPQLNSEPKPEPNPLLEMINVGFEDYKQFEALFKDEYIMADYDSEAEILSDPKFLPKPGYPGEMNHLKALLEAELDFPAPPSYNQNMNTKSPAYLAYKKKMTKVHKRKLLKSLLKKHVTKPIQLSLVDNSLTDEQVDEMILTCLKLEQAKGKLTGMPDSEPFGHGFGY